MDFIRSTRQPLGWHGGAPSPAALPLAPPELRPPDDDVQISPTQALALLARGWAQPSDEAALIERALGSRLALPASLLRNASIVHSTARASTVGPAASVATSSAMAPAGSLMASLPLLAAAAHLPTPSCSTFCAGPCGACLDGGSADEASASLQATALPPGAKQTSSGDSATSPLAQLDDGTEPAPALRGPDLRMLLLPSSLPSTPPSSPEQCVSAIHGAAERAITASVIRTDAMEGTRAPIRMEAPAPVEALRDGQPVQRTLNRIELNPSMLGVSGNILVRTTVPGQKIDIPAAATLARFVTRQFAPGHVSEKTVSEIWVVPDLQHLPEPSPTPSGEVVRVRGKDVVVDSDPDGSYHRTYVAAHRLREDLSPATGFDASTLKLAGQGEKIAVPVATRHPLGPLVKSDASVFCGGLVSISAEPPEGFFSASTALELRDLGHDVVPAAQADMWLYRVPDSRPDSYFNFKYANADRPTDTPRDDKFKIATGVGPAADPTSRGGSEASLLWLGDEQHGALDAYLKTLAKPDLAMEDLFGHQGFIQKLSDQEVLLGSPDRAHAMGKEGFNALPTDPALYRRVYSTEYDEFLRTLFEDPGEPKAKASYLLATSRGCSQGCDICSSGGLKSFQYFTAPRMMEELEKIAAHAQVKEGELVDIFFLDSNLNNNPERLIELADLYEKSPVAGKFRFFCRHSSPNGFLRADDQGVKRPIKGVLDAYRRLGMNEVWMGIDAFDDNGTLTLKTNRHQVAEKRADARPTYRAGEIRELIREMEKHGLTSKGFCLTDNPWVSDLDRLDAYYNLRELWLENPHFSIDSRNRDALQLKPFAGSPVGNVAREMKLPIAPGGWFAASGVLGEMDEGQQFEALGVPRYRGDAGAVVHEFREGIARIRAGAESVLANPASTPEQRNKASLIIRKVMERDAGIMQQMAREATKGTPGAARFLDDARAFGRTHADLPPLEPQEQKREFVIAAQSLFDGLRKTLPLKMERGDAPEGAP